MLAARFVRLLGAAVAAPEAPLHRLEILGPEERHTLLEGVQRSPRGGGEARCPSSLRPRWDGIRGGLALVWGAQELSYGELNARANRLAHHLIGHGVGPERLVGIALERSVDMVVALLATLKAGGAYLPLDPDYPAARLAHMLGEAAPAVVLSTRAAGAARLPTTAALLALDAPRDPGSARPRPRTHNPTDAEPAAPRLPARTRPMPSTPPAHRHAQRGGGRARRAGGVLWRPGGDI